MKLGMAYYGSHLPDHLLSDMTEIRQMGCDELLITLSENDFNIFKGKVQFGPAIAHDLGMRILANFWGFACAFGGGRLSLLLTNNPDVWMQLRDGSRLGQGCMNHPALLALARQQVDRCIAAGYDGFFWDEPTTQDCFCPHCQAKYAQTVGAGQPVADLLLADAEHVAAFRQASISGYVRAMSDYVKSQSTKLETATCVMPVDQAAWEDTASIPSLDTFGTDPYWFCWNQPASWVSGSTRETLELCQRTGKRSLMWLQGWAMPAGREGEIEEAAHLIAAEGPDALYTWGYRAGLGTNEACADPARAWETIKRAYAALKR